MDFQKRALYRLVYLHGILSIFIKSPDFNEIKEIKQLISVFGDIDFPENEQICNFIDWSIFRLEHLEQKFPCRNYMN